MKNWMDMTKEEIKETIGSLQEPSFRAKQVIEWLNKGVRPEQMTNLPKSLRDKMSQIPFGGASIYQKYVSSKDGTVKYLFSLEDNNIVEGVLMRNSYGNTACLSTQIGCNMGCLFCASTLNGCVRNLHDGEMLSFLSEMEQDEANTPNGSRVVTNIVLMGSGEPLDNYDQVVSFLRRVTAKDGRNISPRNISVSTCGIVPKIYRFMEDAPHVTLSISLHAHNDEIRRTIMPVAKVYPIHDLLQAAKAYADKTGRRVIFEYALIGKTNDSHADAIALSKALRGIMCHVNLIPLNPVKERGLLGVSREHAYQFCKWLQDEHISATVRREMGADIEGACGQLRRRVLSDENSRQN